VAIFLAGGGQVTVLVRNDINYVTTVTWSFVYINAASGECCYRHDTNFVLNDYIADIEAYPTSHVMGIYQYVFSSMPITR